MVRIEDVARHAGVSIATVSRVINGNYRVSTAKYNKVLKAIEELGYKSTKLQSENRQKQILIISSLINEDMIRCFEDSASKLNLSTLYKYIPESEVDIDMLPSKSDFDGIIILDALVTAETYEKLKKLCPVVLCRVQYNYPDTVSVSVDDELVAYDITSYFIKKGKRNIALVCDMDRSISSGTTNLIRLADRKRILNGYYLAHIDNGLPIRSDLIIYADDFVESNLVESRFRELLADPEICPDAVFSASIAFALDLMEIAKSCGKQMPRDIEFATCGGMFSHLELPGITYAGQPLDRLADVSVQTLNSMMKGELPADRQHHIYIEHTFLPGR